MTAIDDAIAPVNHPYREFKSYTGDGLPGEQIGAPFPIGDPCSGVERQPRLLRIEVRDQGDHYSRASR